jgi:hypothetical protein
MTIILILIVAGVALWGINTYIPMAKRVKTILNVVVVLVLCLWLLQTFGILDKIIQLISNYQLFSVS